MIPTPEQEQAVAAFGAGGPLVITAGAGTGKTSTLEMLARSTDRTGTYLAFNRSIVDEAVHRFPNTVTVRTMHQFAIAKVGDQLNASARLHGGVVPTPVTAKRLGLGPVIAEVDGRRKVLQPSALAGQVMRAVRAFCRSGDRIITVDHFPHMKGIDPPTGPQRNNADLAAELLPAAEAAWLDLLTPSGQLRFTHDVYLKAWQLGGYRLPGDYVLFDEAQDANPVMLAARSCA